MIVLKFGGSSLADACAIERVAAIVASRVTSNPVVVVSAIGDTTDHLAAVLAASERGDAETARETIRAIVEEHKTFISSVVPEGPASESAAALEREASVLGRFAEGMAALGEVTGRSRDAVLAFGEIVAAQMIADAFRAKGIDAVPVDPRDVVATDGQHGAAAPDELRTAQNARRILGSIADAGRVPVVGGFVGSSGSGATTTLGRGGSDLTASLVASALGAASLEFWKDVDGILTADPRVVPDARPVPRITYREASELAFLGARVLHPASIKPAVDAGIPIRVLNSHRPESAGTEIAERIDPASRPGTATSIAHKADQVLVNIHSTRMLGATGFLRRVFEVFDKHRVSVDHIATSEVNVTVTIGAQPGIDGLVDELSQVATIAVRHGVGVVSVVGERLSTVPGTASEVFGALVGTDVRLLTYGGFGVNLSLVLDGPEVEPAVRRLHEKLFAPIARREEELHG